MVRGDGEAPSDQALNLYGLHCLWKRIALPDLSCIACKMLGFPSDFERVFSMQGIFKIFIIFLNGSLSWIPV